MARDGVTFEQVEAAADVLTGEGLAPTIRAVRERLGSTGSPNTIQKHLARWRELRPSAAVPAANIPAGILSAIAQEIERAATQARAETEARLVLAQTEVAELATHGEALEAEREALSALAGELTRERDTLTGKAAEQTQEIERQAREIERERQAAEAARIELRPRASQERDPGPEAGRTSSRSPTPARRPGSRPAGRPAGRAGRRRAGRQAGGLRAPRRRD